MKQVKGWWFPEADEFMAKELHENGTYQGDHLAAAMDYVTDFRLAVDGGAHVGTWSKAMCGVFNRVIAFEPSPDTAEALRENMRQFRCSNVVVMEAALSDRHETVRMTFEDSPQAVESKNTGARYMAQGGEITALTLDSLKLESLGFLKLDIEGAEYKAFCGAKETLKRCRPVILFEDKRKCQHRFGVRRSALYELLRSLGYKHATRAGCDEIWIAA